MVILDRSSTSVLHTTSESMLKPRAARIPDTRDKTPGSFCTKQLRTCFLGGAELGKGVSYRMDETAAGADHEGGLSDTGRGEMRRWRAL
jgi:hypothetical protein